MENSEKIYHSFEEFWPFYLSQHRNPICRNLHIVGTTLAVIALWYFLATSQYSMIILCPVIGYGFSWIGHFVFEKNRPATFTYPRWSFMGDMRMLKLFFTGNLKTELSRNGIR